jgi:cytochrome c-type biogenesis protein CcmH
VVVGLLAFFVREIPYSGAVLAAQIAATSDSALEARVRAVASELRCPVCQGESIQDSPAGLAQEMRVVVREQLAAGRTPEEVKKYFSDKYGEWILLRPRARGWNVIVYVLPVVALHLGVLVVMRVTRRWARPEESGSVSAPHVETTTPS